jgi:hypothetical protein
MGFFSWMTDDTNKSIANIHSDREAFAVTMTDNKGNSWTEEEYDGYGEFDGKDFYSLLSEMNGGDGDRDHGIGLYFGKEAFLCPNLTEDPKWKWQNSRTDDCPEQGFFYGDSDEDEDDYL